MKTDRFKPLLVCGIAILFAASGISALPARAQTAETTTAAAAADADEAQPLTEDELEILVARIALYPDDLVAVVMASSIYPLQVVQAARFLEDAKKDPNLKPSDKWDGSVISLLNYPSVVKMMNDDLDWTEQLGTAVANQEKDVLVAIQQLRDEAVQKGVLKSDEKVVVAKEKEKVVIKSSDPQTVYVPTYPPEMLYEPNYVYPPEPIVYAPYPSYYYPTATYWAGFVTGAAWAAVVDWDDWGAWGGDIDIDVNNINNRFDVDFDKIDINNIDRDKLNNFDFRNIDRSKMDFKNLNIDKSKLTQNLKSRNVNNLAHKTRNRQSASNLAARSHDLKGKDIRKSAAEGLKNRPAANVPKPKPAQRVDRPAAQQRVQKAAANKPAARHAVERKAAPRKPAARPDNRPRTPSAIGHPERGRIAANHSNRGAYSRGGGHRGGELRGGGHRSRPHRR